MRSSSAMMNDASSTSWCSSASIVRSICETTRSIPPRVASSRAASSAWKLGRPSLIDSAELPGDVVLGARVVGLGEDLLGLAVLDQLAVEHERRGVGHARRLLHVVRDDDDRVALLELVDELFDAQRRDRVERARR